jgi:hypothetical protein
VYADPSVNSQVHYYITPSLSVDCPGDPCLTLPQFAANSTNYLGNETNVSLSFLPGNHSLDGELSLSNADNFSMTMVIATPATILLSTALFLVTCPYYPEVHQAVNRCFKRWAVCT